MPGYEESFLDEPILAIYQINLNIYVTLSSLLRARFRGRVWEIDGFLFSVSGLDLKIFSLPLLHRFDEAFFFSSSPRKAYTRRRQVSPSRIC